MKLDGLVREGKISGYTAMFNYVDAAGEEKSHVMTDTTGGISTYNFFRGISTVEYAVKPNKGGRTLGTAVAAKKVVHFPDLAADKTVDDDGRVLLAPTASDKKVTLSCNANSYSGIFWAKDGVKLKDSDGKSTWTVDLSGAAGIGWYGLGYPST